MHEAIDALEAGCRTHPVATGISIGLLTGLTTGLTINPTSIGVMLAVTVGVWAVAVPAAVAIEVHQAHQASRDARRAVFLIAPVAGYLMFAGTAVATTSVRQPSPPRTTEAPGLVTTTTEATPVSVDAEPTTTQTTLPAWMSDCSDPTLDEASATAVGLPRAMWPAIADLAADPSVDLKSYRLCAARVVPGSWITDLVVGSAASGPGGHILVADRGDSYEAQFVPPLIGAMAYSQLDDGDFEAWGFPDPPIPFGTSGQSITIYRGRDREVTGYSLWAVTPDATTGYSNRASAWFTPASVAVSLLKRLSDESPLPLAVGRATVTSDASYQEFIGFGVVRDQEGVLDAAELLAHCHG